MVSSELNKYIFIPVPKTGTVSIQNFLLNHDKSCRHNAIYTDGEWMEVDGYVTARDLEGKLGSKLKEYKTFSLIRNPYAKFVSHYFFLKDVKSNDAGSPNNGLKEWLAILAAKLLPFTIWSIVYPYRSNMSHVCSRDGEVLVSYIGVFEKYNEHVREIFLKLDLDMGDLKLPHTHKTSRRPYEDYYKNAWHKKIIDKKVKEDLDFYQRVKQNSFLTQY